MEVQVLREAIKGYKKNEVMMKLDRLNVLLMGAQDGSISKAEAQAQAKEIAESPVSKVFLRGFNIEDTDNYIREIVEKINAL